MAGEVKRGLEHIKGLDGGRGGGRTEPKQWDQVTKHHARCEHEAFFIIGMKPDALNTSSQLYTNCNEQKLIKYWEVFTMIARSGEQIGRMSPYLGRRVGVWQCLVQFYVILSKSTKHIKNLETYVEFLKIRWLWKKT